MKRILIVEDEPFIAQVYRMKFSRRGFLVEVAVDGQSGLERIASWKPDLVLLDIMLPKIDGLELLRKVRANVATRALPVIVYSNSLSTSMAEEAAQLGVLHVLAKSQTRPAQVLELVASILESGPVFPEPTPTPSAESNEQARCTLMAKETLQSMRLRLKEYFGTNNISILANLNELTHTFGAIAWLAGLQKAGYVAEGLEALLKTLCEHQKYITFSTDKTVLQGIDCLEHLISSSGMSDSPNLFPSILVVDDQEISLRAAALALKKARLVPLCIADPEEALKLMETRSFDLVLLDIDMPNLNGMDLCTQMRLYPQHQLTPVVFFSQLSEIEYRMASMSAGGNDFIGKPYLTIELAVKALVWLNKPPAIAIA